MKNEQIFAENNGLIREYFRMANEVTDEIPNEDDCQTLLEGAMKIIKIIKESNEPVLAHNFQDRWAYFKKNVQPYADPATFKFYETEVEKNLQSLLS